MAISPDRPLPPASESGLQESSTWVLKANVTVFRHADRTPKQKLKFNFPIGEVWTQPFVRLLNGKNDEIILRDRAQLELIAKAVDEATHLGADGEHLTKLTALNTALFSKIDYPGTKAQLKPAYSKKVAGQVRKLTKLTLVFKWGGEVIRSMTRSACSTDDHRSSRTLPATNRGISVRTSRRYATTSNSVAQLVLTV
jgi:inositol-hexakisphosphate/diphosphoinositol-pentakisphosphate 1-kinase